MKNVIFLLMLISTACNRWQFLDVYQFRPDCWQTYVMVYEDERRDTTRLRIPCDRIIDPDKERVEPEWKISYERNSRFNY